MLVFDDGVGDGEIARALGRSKSTVSREVGRNSFRAVRACADAPRLRSGATWSVGSPALGAGGSMTRRSLSS